MKIPAVMPITAAQSRASRFQLGLTQNQVISGSGVPGYKLKQFETGRFVPEQAFLQKLADFYTSKGIDLSDPDVSTDPADPSPAPAKKPGADMVRSVQRPCFYVSESVSQELLDQCLERMHHNDERIAEILNKELRVAMFGGMSEATQKEHQELFGAMAECYLIFRLLQGNPIVAPVDSDQDPKSHAELLGQFYAKSPVAAADPAAPAVAAPGAVPAPGAPAAPAAPAATTAKVPA